MDSIFSDSDPLDAGPAAPPNPPAGAEANGAPDDAPHSRRLTLKITRNRVLSDGEDAPMPARATRSNTNGEFPTGRSLRSRSGNGTGSPDSFAQSQLPRTTRSGRTVAATYRDDDDDDEDDLPLALGKKRATSSRPRRTRNDDFIEDDEDGADSDAMYGARSSRPRKPAPSRSKKSPRKRARLDDEDEEFQLTGKSELETDEDSGSHDFDAPVTSPSPDPSPRRSNVRPAPRSPRGYTLRPQRRPINYEIPPPLDNDTSFAAAVASATTSTRQPRPLVRNLSRPLLDNLTSLPAPPPINDDSDSDDPSHQVNKASTSAGNAAGGQGLIGAGGATNDIATAAGGPANFGKVSKDSCKSPTPQHSERCGTSTNPSNDRFVRSTCGY